MDIQNLVIVVLGAAGFGAFASALVNVLKSVAVVQDGQAPNWIAGINLIAVIALYVLGVKGITINVSAMDATFGQLAQVIVIAGQLVIQLVGSSAFHSALKGAKLIGKSYSL